MDYLEFIKIVESAAVGDNQMLVRSGDLLYAWDLARGMDCCVVARQRVDGSIEILDCTTNDSA